MRPSFAAFEPGRPYPHGIGGGEARREMILNEEGRCCR